MSSERQKALVTLRPDLTLQVSSGDTPSDVALSDASAHELAALLIKTLQAKLARAPGDDLIESLYTLAVCALDVAQRLQRVTDMDSETRLLATLAIERGFGGLYLLREDLPTLEDLENAQKH